MKKIVIKYGLLSGAITTGLTAIMLPLCMNGTIDFSNTEIIGYTAMFASFLLVFFGIRAYRENAAGGAITFGKAFQVGILITLISCLMYVVSWEIVYFNFVPDFEEKFAAVTLDKLRQSGASAEVVAKKTAEMEQFMKLYKNPLFNIGITFLEVFPVGLVMTLVSAAILRKKTPPDGSEPATAIA